MEKAAKTKKEARDEKLKEQKMEEQVLKSLEDVATPEEKFQMLLRKHVESERESRRLRQDLKIHERQLEAVLREKENLQREFNKSVLMRDKLQEVCREQQKLIKSVKNESMQKIREEEERRKESQNHFQTSLNDITTSMAKNNEENLKLRDHNVEMAKKLKFLAEQYQTREVQLGKLSEQAELESKLHAAKLAKLQVEGALEKEILVKEKHIALEKLERTQQVLNDLSEREAQLKAQLNLYTSKYDDFQSSLQKSNTVFATYKVELEKMTKNTKKLEREALEWRHKWEKSNATLIELATEKKDRDEHAMRCNKQVEQLQKLLRALQHERTHLHKVLKEKDIECPAMPSLPPEPEMLKITPITTAQSTSDRIKMEMMSKNCAELKETLASLQNQVNFFSINKEATATESAAVAASRRKGGKKVTQPQQQQKQQEQQQPSEEAHKKRQRKRQKNKNHSEANKESSPASLGTEEEASVKELEAQLDGKEREVLQEAETLAAEINGVNENREEEERQEEKSESPPEETIAKEEVLPIGEAEPETVLTSGETKEAKTPSLAEEAMPVEPQKQGKPQQKPEKQSPQKDQQTETKEETPRGETEPPTAAATEEAPAAAAAACPVPN